MAVNKASKLNDVSCENISKIDDVLKSNIRYFDNNDFSCQQTTPTPTPTPTITPTSTPPSVTPTPTPTPANCVEGHIPKDTNYEYRDCCYPYLQISGNSGPATEGLTVCFNPNGTRVNVTTVSPTVVCDTGVLTTCCEVFLGYSDVDSSTACAAEATLFYISTPCKATSCDLNGAFAIYTDNYCTTLAPDGYYSDGTDFYVMSGGVISGPYSC